ncbi:unnamed protein product [Rhizoctonia solani]|uniref:Uncharacterized protein n=1 Tax=Rhizoctonia solani TaxID=456999 RepID=A0A8H3HNW4_9AGAM|nr:unnamed protein product [Rhizoctonia solani]
MLCWASEVDSGNGPALLPSLRGKVETMVQSRIDIVWYFTRAPKRCVIILPSNPSTLLSKNGDPRRSWAASQYTNERTILSVSDQTTVSIWTWRVQLMLYLARANIAGLIVTALHSGDAALAAQSESTSLAGWSSSFTRRRRRRYKARGDQVVGDEVRGKTASVAEEAVVLNATANGAVALEEFSVL